MSQHFDLRCPQCQADSSSLRLSVTERVWYLLDVADDGIYPHQPERDGKPGQRLLCLDCGYDEPLPPEISALLRD